MINVDLPWNPAVLEQRIARAHRMGQRRPVQVFVLVTEGTIEENLLATLSAKHDLAMAALDADSDVTQVDLVSGIEELRRRLEVLLGAVGGAAGRFAAGGGPPPGRPTPRASRSRGGRRRTAPRRGGRPAGRTRRGRARKAPSEAIVSQVHDRLATCVEDDPSGKPRLSITLPDRQVLDKFARTLAALLVPAEAS